MDSLLSPKHSGLAVQLVDGQCKSCGLLATAALQMGQYRDSADVAVSVCALPSLWTLCMCACSASRLLGR